MSPRVLVLWYVPGNRLEGNPDNFVKLKSISMAALPWKPATHFSYVPDIKKGRGALRGGIFSSLKVTKTKWNCFSQRKSYMSTPSKLGNYAPCVYINVNNMVVFAGSLVVQMKPSAITQREWNNREDPSELFLCLLPPTN